MGTLQAPERFNRLAWGTRVQGDPSSPPVGFVYCLWGRNMDTILLQQPNNFTQPVPTNVDVLFFRWVYLLEDWQMAQFACGTLLRFWPRVKVVSRCWLKCRNTQGR